MTEFEAKALQLLADISARLQSIEAVAMAFEKQRQRGEAAQELSQRLRDSFPPR